MINEKVVEFTTVSDKHNFMINCQLTPEEGVVYVVIVIRKFVLLIFIVFFVNVVIIVVIAVCVVVHILMVEDYVIIFNSNLYNCNTS